MSRTLLLADDSIMIHKVVELTFEKLNFEVVTVANGDEAMVRLAAQVPDVVLADVHMPGASGYEICQSVKAQAPETPVILLVGTFERFDEAAASECGADGHLLKPFDSQELLRMVQTLAGSTDSRADESGSSSTGSEAVSAHSSTALEEESLSDEIAAAVAASVEAPLIGEESTPDDGEPDASTISPDEAPADVAEIEESRSDGEIADQPEPGEAQAIQLSDEDVERVARRVVELLGDEVLREIAWEVVPDMAEVVITERLRDLERQVE